VSYPRAAFVAHDFGAPKHGDNMAEWLRRQPAKLMGCARVGSNPTVVVFQCLTVTESVFCLYYAPNGSTWKHRPKGLDSSPASGCFLAVYPVSLVPVGMPHTQAPPSVETIHGSDCFRCSLTFPLDSASRCLRELGNVNR
jgi:hypothetical protein